MALVVNREGVMTKRKERDDNSEIRINEGVINKIRYWLTNAQNHYEKNDLNSAFNCFKEAKAEAKGHYIPITYEWTINYGLSTICFMHGEINEAEKYAKLSIRATNINNFNNSYNSVLPPYDLLFKIYISQNKKDLAYKTYLCKIDALNRSNNFFENSLKGQNSQKEINKKIICIQDNNVEIYNTCQSLIDYNLGAEQENKNYQFQISLKTQKFIQEQLKLAVDSKSKADSLSKNEILEYNKIITEYQKSFMYLNQISTYATQQFQPDKLNEIENLKHEINGKIKDVEEQKKLNDLHFSNLSFSGDIETLLKDPNFDNWCKDLLSGSGDNLSYEENPFAQENPFDIV